ncbi:MAG: GH116 family glycosyl hydrolase [Candidatus Woesearchaeota archaeon]
MNKSINFLSEENLENIKKAFEIAKNNLRDCYGDLGIYAGLHHFKDYWARDGFFASFGSLILKDYNIVKKNLELFLKNVNKEGQLPLRIGKSSFEIALSYIMRRYDSKRKPIYFIDKSNKKPVDQNSLFIISFYEYIKETKDIDFLKNNITKIEKIMEWNFNQDKDNDYLIEEDEFCNWADSIKKRGKVLYTNVCFCYALKCMENLYRILNNEKKEIVYNEKYKIVKSKINERFWQGEYYLDWIIDEKNLKKTFDYFSSDGNFLAVIWDIADKEKSKKIEEASHIFDIHEIPSKCVHPNYSNKLVSFQTKLIGLKDYHNGLSWLWLGCINAISKNKVNMKKEAIDILLKMSNLIIKYNGVYEVYDKEKPVRRLIYNAEIPFAWSSGMFLYACNEILGLK